jgi:hypothetical protein
LNLLSNAVSVVGILLECVCVVLLLRGAYCSYPFLLVSCLVVLIGQVSVGVAFSTAGVHSDFYSHVYWTADVVDYFVRFLVVVTLTYRVTEGSPLRAAVGRLLPIIAIVAVVLPFVLYHPYFNGRWFRHTSQVLNLSAAFMNLLLWTAILGRRGARDRQLLLVSVGVGITVTAMAVSYGVVQFMSSATLRWFPDMFKILSETAGSAIWCWAFWPDPGRSRRTQHPLVEQSPV